MSKLGEGRSGFREWVDSFPDPGWSPMPLTHITKGVRAQDIITSNKVAPAQSGSFDEPLAYFFYGRPAYRLSPDGVVKAEASCPFCFVFKAELVGKARAIFAFDTGAFKNRLYKHALDDEMDVNDFCLGTDASRANKLIATVFGSRSNYFDGDTTKIPDPGSLSNAWDFHPRAYLNLLLSPGRNEPDDRICSIEVLFDHQIQLAGNLLAVVAPHTVCQAPWLGQLRSAGVAIAPYNFVPCRHPEHYHALMEIEVKKIYALLGPL